MEMKILFKLDANAARAQADRERETEGQGGQRGKVSASAFDTL